MGSTVNLVVVVVQTSDMSAGELGNLAGRASNTTTNVKDFHSLFYTNAVGEVVLVTGNGLVEGLAEGEATEMERLAPAVFVQISSEVVVASS